MRSESRQRAQFFFGFLTSLGLHVVLALLTIVLLQNSAARATKTNEVFSVTLEGGANLGGFSQVPKENAKKILTPAPNEEPEEAKESTQETTRKETQPETTKEAVKPEEKPIKLTVPSAVDDPQKLIAQKKLDEQKEKQKKLEQEKKLEEKKKKEEEEEKKKERALRDRQLAETLKKLKNQYAGESADIGGKGFGAAALGGKGMGGGTLSSLEKIAYSNTLQKHVKEGWRWLNSSGRLIAKVEVSILRDGRIQNVNIIQKSGNPNFDDSVVRAVFKASPVPPAPENLYEEFKDVVFTFDSAE